MTQSNYPEDSLHDQYWYAHQETQTSTGWYITRGNYTLDMKAPSDTWVTGFADEFSAKYITRLHNQALHERKQREDPEHDRSSCYCCCFDCPEDLDK